MKTYLVPLSNQASAAAEKEAEASGLEVSAFLAATLHDHFSSKQEGPPVQQTSPSTSPSGEFSVARAFPNYPVRSVEITQAFVDEALKFPGVLIHQHKRSLIFNPRFVFVDYPISNRGKVPGLVASFYGDRDQFNDPRGVLYPGRTSFSRMRILTDEDLSDSFRFLKQSHQLRVGKSKA